MPIRNLSDLKKFLPLPTEPEAEKAFSTYQNYLVHIERCLGGEYGVGASFVPGVVAVVRGASRFSRINRRTLSESEASSSPTRSESPGQRNFNCASPAISTAMFLPFLIHGSGIHAYYVVFHGARALFTGAGQSVTASHSATLSTLSSWVSDRDVFPVPWSVRCVGGPKREMMTILGKPSYATTSGGVSSLSAPSPATVWDFLDMLLFTTRDRQVDEGKKQWRPRHRRMRLSAAEATQLCANLPATTLFNMLFRLRKRSDYSDADAFLDGIPTAAAATEYHSAISTFVHATLAVVETLVVAYSGSDIYKSAAYRFLNQVSGPASDALRTRRAAIVGA